MAGTGRVIAVLGYSPRRSDQLHPVCAARVERACEIAREGDVVVLSGWSRHPAVESEAELMARAWHGPAVELVTEMDARHTVGNAAVVAREARDAEAAELVLVTSWWHSRRATLLVRAALHGSDMRVTAVRAPSQPSFALLAREAFFLAVLPLQLLALRRAAKSDPVA